VLGIEQRQWLERALLESRAPLKLIVSGSVLLGSSVLDTVCDDAAVRLPARRVGAGERERRQQQQQKRGA
jgi:phosphodiesterase/alkaline phosphatase D-like protein